MSGDPTGDAPATGDPVLSVRDLTVRIGTRRGVARVVNGVSYDVHAGETLAIVGESGSGKTVAALAVMGLLDEPARVGGQALLDGTDLLALDERQLRRVRGNQIAMVFQDPMTSLNPVKTIGSQLVEPIVLHGHATGAAARDRAADLLDQVGLPDARRRLDDYPHQFSGGMRQRVMIAMALACEPRVLLADEATTALDVTTQAQILDVVAGLQQRLGLAVVWITHDLGVVAGIADRVAVMYAGRILEEAGVDNLYAAPRHPYTIGLLSAVPRVGVERPRRLATIGGQPPDPTALPPGCAFHPRCGYRHDERAASEVPPLRTVAAGGHRVACFYDVPAGQDG
ncbi:MULTISPECIES: ABC transporter ATP-binding protein [unclassified Solwaraspora]|uniref:ABC transporter ATP-binding protein n=1 Tax=unclassified Solwaraspora TaxID=2627926 RepID=UPI00248B02F2|nr:MULTISPECIES: ABC transporter ATP-binding protein [unclassified Solwaraspora]WBB98947.1 ABC transporter ATP-binding protein [Solwaraspora sp. WMMA2059]WBC22500.1 ABC transporter ATP-binding protein [Solwaraspora sp. WMMA2080]WJK35447.1 ABC transporter ATP-binding protein [Solwaraspora sp. WMMA2065]